MFYVSVMVLLPMLYLPPVSYMAILYAAGDIGIEAQENYSKSTYRNRCEIAGSNGLIDLSIPLIGGRDHHQRYLDAQISYTSDWQHRHRMSIVSCYGSTPFFEHYMPYLESFYERRWDTLFDYNKDLLQLLIRLMKIEVKLSYTDVYEKAFTAGADLRHVFKPGRVPSELMINEKRFCLQMVPYMSVFDTRRTLELSSLDLLFNEGAGAKSILQQMITEI